MKRYVLFAALLAACLIAAALAFGGMSVYTGAGLFLIVLACVIPLKKIPAAEASFFEKNQRIPSFLKKIPEQAVLWTMLAGSAIYIAASFTAIFPESALAVDTCTLDLKSKQETEYTRRVTENKQCFMIAGSFSEDIRVFGDGQQLDPISPPAVVTRSTYWNPGKLLVVSKELKELKIQSPRKIFSYLRSPCWIVGLFLLAACLLTCREIFLKEEDNRHGRLLAAMLFISAAVCCFFQMAPQLFPLKYAVDGWHYLMLSNGDLFTNSLISYRTPGYPLFLRAMQLFSPVSLGSACIVQCGIFFTALILLLREMHLRGLPLLCCFVLELLFSKYMWSYHNFAIADSLNLSGVILLLAFSMMMFRRLEAGSCSCRLKITLHASAMILVFLQLMIKPFPGTILIPAGMLFLEFAARKNWKRAFGHAVLCACLCVLLPLLFCAFRYYRYGDFNFASIASFQVASSALLLADETKFSELEPEVRSDVESIIKETLAQNPDLKWPMDLSEQEKNAEIYTTYANRFMYHPGLWNGSWLKNKNESAYPSHELCLEFESRKLAKALLPLTDGKKLLKLRLIYLNELGRYFQYPRLCADLFSGNSPFRSPKRCFFLLLLPLALAIAAGRMTGQNGMPYLTFNASLIRSILIAAVLGALGILSTCLLVAPYVEVRREMIGLFSLLFGTFALMLYAYWILGISICKFIAGGCKKISGIR